MPSGGQDVSHSFPDTTYVHKGVSQSCTSGFLLVIRSSTGGSTVASDHINGIAIGDEGLPEVLGFLVTGYH